MAADVVKVRRVCAYVCVCMCMCMCVCVATEITTQPGRASQGTIYG